MLDPDIAAGDEPADVAVPPPPRRRRRRILTNGPLTVFLIIASSGGWPKNIPQSLHNRLEHLDVGGVIFLVGAAVGRWRLV
eukprot:56647-Pyramimonas_sp.AAC.1